MLRPCRQPGCPELVQRGYCAQHAPTYSRERFKVLDARVPSFLRDFYSGARWTAASRLHRTSEPLCRRCKEKGRIVCGELSHHNPPLEELLRTGKNPYNDEYLETLCTPCHQRELFAKSKKTN